MIRAEFHSIYTLVCILKWFQFVRHMSNSNMYDYIHFLQATDWVQQNGHLSIYISLHLVIAFLGKDIDSFLLLHRAASKKSINLLKFHCS